MDEAEGCGGSSVTAVWYSSAPMGYYQAHGSGLVLITVDIRGRRVEPRMEDREDKMGPFSISASSGTSWY